MMDFSLGSSRRGLPQILLDVCKLAVASELEADALSLLTFVCSCSIFILVSLLLKLLLMMHCILMTLLPTSIHFMHIMVLQWGHFLKEGIILQNVHSFIYTFTPSTFKDPKYVSSNQAEKRQTFSLKKS